MVTKELDPHLKYKFNWHWMILTENSRAVDSQFVPRTSACVCDCTSIPVCHGGLQGKLSIPHLALGSENRTPVDTVRLKLMDECHRESPAHCSPSACFPVRAGAVWRDRVVRQGKQRLRLRGRIRRVVDKGGKPGVSRGSDVRLPSVTALAPDLAPFWRWTRACCRRANWQS